MSYIGNTPAESFISFEKQVFTIVNSQTAYTLSHSVVNENDIRLVINNVVQEPGSGKAYTASGTTLNLSAALTNGTDTMYCVFLGRALQTVNAPNASVGTAQLGSSLDFSSKTITLASNMKNTPAFAVYQGSDVTLNENTETTLTWNSELFDTDNAFSSNRFTCPSGGAGKYKFTVYARLTVGNSEINWIYLVFKKNGSYVHSGSVPFWNFESNQINVYTATISNVITLAENDYVEAIIAGNFASASTGTITATANEFSGYRLIGV